MPDKSAALKDSHNVDYQRGYMSDEELRQLQNAHRFHVCPSEAEGWGHYIAEAMSVRAVTITTDAAPMNELVRPERGLLVAGREGEQHNLARLICFDEAALEQAIGRCLGLRTRSLRPLAARRGAGFWAIKAALPRALRPQSTRSLRSRVRRERERGVDVFGRSRHRDDTVLAPSGIPLALPR